MANLTNPNRHLMIKAMGSAPKESNIKTIMLIMLPRTSELTHQYDSPDIRKILR